MTYPHSILQPMDDQGLPICLQNTTAIHFHFSPILFSISFAVSDILLIYLEVPLKKILKKFNLHWLLSVSGV